jgi:hypothetical protein
VSPARAELLVTLTMRVLAASFAVVGILFVATPDGVIGRMADVGDAFGDFADGPKSEQKLWLGLAFAYMTVITGIALVVASDPVRHRPLLLVLAAGKAASSLTTGAFFAFDEDVFIYLLNFIVDGGLVFVALWCWTLTAKIPQRSEVAAPG